MSWVARECREHDALYPVRDAWFQGGRRGEWLGECASRQVVRRLAAEGSLACQQLIEHGAQTVLIRPLIHWSTTQLLGRHVFGCAHRWAGVGDGGALSGNEPHLACDAEIGEEGLTSSVEQNILWLHVTMDQAGCVSLLQSARHLKR
jgi:hypothetical protein